MTQNAYRLTSQIVTDYHKAISSYVDADVVTIQDIQPLLLALDKGADLLEVLDIANTVGLPMIQQAIELVSLDDLRDFLERTALTLPAFDETVIYVPWVPGRGDAQALARQVRILAHEGTHALRAQGNARWAVKYLAGFKFRKTEEKWAFHTSMEMHHWCWGTVPPANLILHAIKKYYLPPTHIKVLTKELEGLRGPAADGALYTEMGKFATGWLNERILR